MRTESTRTRRLAAVGVVAAGLGVLADRAISQGPAAAPRAEPEPTLIDPKAADYGTRPVAYIYGNVPVTRADLSEYLIARGGYERVELLVNKRIVEIEAARRGVTVTPQEMEAELNTLCETLPNKRADFVNTVLPKFGKTLFEYMEDMVRPRLLLAKMCKDRVKVTDDDLKVAFERQYGEKREAQIILWPKGDNPKVIFAAWDKVRKDPAAFDAQARTQANPALASQEGRVTVSKHAPANEKVLQEETFKLNPGEVSRLIETEMGTLVIKLSRVVPPAADVKPEQVKDRLTKEMFEQKLSEEIPKYFAELSTAAAPLVLLKGPPTQWKFEQTNRQMADQVLKQSQQGVTPADGKK